MPSMNKATKKRSRRLRVSPSRELLQTAVSSQPVQDVELFNLPNLPSEPRQFTAQGFPEASKARPVRKRK